MSILSIQDSGKVKYNRTPLKADIQIYHEAVIENQIRISNLRVHRT
jgi:hypothetical protein